MSHGLAKPLWSIWNPDFWKNCNYRRLASSEIVLNTRLLKEALLLSVNALKEIRRDAVRSTHLLFLLTSLMSYSYGSHFQRKPQNQFRAPRIKLAACSNDLPGHQKTMLRSWWDGRYRIISPVKASIVACCSVSMTNHPIVRNLKKWARGIVVRISLAASALLIII